MGGRGAGTGEQADVTRTEGEGRGGRGREGRCAAEGCAGADVTREAGEGRAPGPEGGDRKGTAAEGRRNRGAQPAAFQEVTKKASE